jgi:hypothetical protein
MRGLFRCGFTLCLTVLSATTFPAPAYPHHLKMSTSAASRLDHYDRKGEWLKCVPNDSGRLKKKVLFDNHHVAFFMASGRIFLGETADSERCSGLDNGRNLELGQNDDNKICRGDLIISYMAGLPRYCVFLWFQELAIPD